MTTANFATNVAICDNGCYAWIVFGGLDSTKQRFLKGLSGMQDSTLSQIVQIGSGLGVGGTIVAAIGHIFGRRKNDAEAHKTEVDTQNAIQAPVDGRLRTLIEADGARLKQMSDALAQQSGLLLQLQQAMTDQSKLTLSLQQTVDSLEGGVRTLVKHIGSLENLLRAKHIEPPPRPVLHPVAEEAAHA